MRDSLIGSDAFWIVFGFVQAITNRDPRLSSRGSCIEVYDVFGLELTIDMGSPYAIIVEARDWWFVCRVDPAPDRDTDAPTPIFEEHFPSGIEQCLDDLVMLRLILPIYERPLAV